MASRTWTQNERAVGLALRIAANCKTYHATSQLVLLLQQADRLHKYAETACNYGLTEAQAKRVANLEAKVKATCDALGIGVKFNGDPRGYAVKLLLPDGSYNTWGGQEEGWGI